MGLSSMGSGALAATRCWRAVRAEVSGDRGIERGVVFCDAFGPAGAGMTAAGAGGASENCSVLPWWGRVPLRAGR